MPQVNIGANDVCRLDKGTFDAIALAEPMEDGVYMADLYPARVDRLVKAGGYFLITCGYVMGSIYTFLIFL